MRPQKVAKLRLRERRRTEEALHLLTSLSVQKPRLIDCFDALGNDRETEIGVRHDDDGANKGGIPGRRR